MKIVWTRSRTYIALTILFLAGCNAFMGCYESAIGILLYIPLMFYFAHKEYKDDNRRV